jgi:hypothetical protein
LIIKCTVDSMEIPRTPRRGSSPTPASTDTATIVFPKSRRGRPFSLRGRRIELYLGYRSMGLSRVFGVFGASLQPFRRARLL